MSFDWQDGESNWVHEPQNDDSSSATSGSAPQPAEPERTEEPTQRPGRRRLIVSAALVVVLFGVVAAVLARVAGERVRDRETQLTTDVEASYRTIREAAAAQDNELFTSFLSGSDPEWAGTQQALVGAGLWRDRAVFGLPLASSSTLSSTVTLAPDQSSAELREPTRYEIEIGNGLTETVILEHTSLFRQGSDRWLYAPPTAEFWGETLTSEGRYLSLSYPERDAVIGRRLARELDAKLAEYCASSQIGGCPSDLRLEVELSPDPGTLMAAADLIERWQLDTPHRLPTPTLVGLPGDEAGYRALFRGYATHLINGLTGELSGWACCQSSLFYGTLLAAQLRKMGLRPWPLQPADYARFLEDPDQLLNLQAFWRGGTIDPPPSNVWQVYLLVEFLAEEVAAVPILFMQRALLSNPNLDYWSWISLVTGDRYGTQQDFERDLLRFAESRLPNRPSAHQAPGPPTVLFQP